MYAYMRPNALVRVLESEPVIALERIAKRACASDGSLVACTTSVDSMSIVACFDAPHSCCIE